MSNIPPPTYSPPPPPPPGGPTSNASDRTLMIVLAYLWILVLIPLLTKKDDAEVRWHSQNGLGITIGEILAWAAYMAISLFAPSAIACAASALSCIIGLGFFVIRVIAIIKGVGGQRFSVPVLTDLGQKINI